MFLREQGQTQAGREDQEPPRIAGTPCTDSISGNSCFVDDADYYDWPLLAAGCILSHTVLDALMVQAIYNPDIISFWEALTGAGKQGNCGVPANTFRSNPEDSKVDLVRGSTVTSPMKLRRSLSGICMREKRTGIMEEKLEEKKKIGRADTPNEQDEKSFVSPSSSNNQFSAVNLIGETEDSVPIPDRNSPKDSKKSGFVRFQPSDKLDHEANEKARTARDFVGRPGSFDKVDIPQIFVGKTFGHLFNSFLEQQGAIAIALYRSHYRYSNVPEENNRTNLRSSSSTLLPIVITAPAMETILICGDEVFILRRSYLSD